MADFFSAVFWTSLPLSFNSQQSSIASLFEHCRIEIWKWPAMRSFFCRDSTSLLGVISFRQNTQFPQNFRRFARKSAETFSLRKILSPRKSDKKSRHFTLWTHGNLSRKIIWSPIYYKIQGNYFKAKIWVLYKLKTKTSSKG